MSDKTTAALAAEQADTEATTTQEAELLPAATLDELEQVDLGTVAEGERAPFRITDDRCADWAIRKIADERSEYDRLKALADEQIAAINEFLSTPSARRATAKTETKSLFSNKLYNILHEFRRALIYNGSKNYPNHAKRLENPVRRCRKDAEDSPFAPGRKTQNNSRPSCSKGG